MHQNTADERKGEKKKKQLPEKIKYSRPKKWDGWGDPKLSLN